MTNIVSQSRMKCNKVIVNHLSWVMKEMKKTSNTGFVVSCKITEFSICSQLGLVIYFCAILFYDLWFAFCSVASVTESVLHMHQAKREAFTWLLSFTYFTCTAQHYISRTSVNMNSLADATAKLISSRLKERAPTRRSFLWSTGNVLVNALFIHLFLKVSSHWMMNISPCRKSVLVVSFTLILATTLLLYERTKTKQINPLS